ncbi:MAG TPA: PfkB family carbohydrate kinase, partial [Syntrophorhabdaceae bacterium]|nr:PfkB family carbohydrate kinase [Syntrophorhabdaceae bacterium]
MIYTITINPSLDIILEVEELVYDDINKVVAEKKRASGKGIDISRNIKALGGESIALGLIGGFRGLELESMLLNEGIVCDFTRISSETKSNIILQQKKKRIKTFLTTPDPVVSSLDLSLFLKKIRDIPEGSYVIISSAYSETIDRFVYHQIISTLNERGVKTILDGDGDILKHCINARPFMIKPNIYEFSR